MVNAALCYKGGPIFIKYRISNKQKQMSFIRLFISLCITAELDRIPVYCLRKKNHTSHSEKASLAASFVLMSDDKFHPSHKHDIPADTMALM